MGIIEKLKLKKENFREIIQKDIESLVPIDINKEEGLLEENNIITIDVDNLTKKPTIEKTISKKPTIEKTISKKPTSKKPTSKKPTSKKPTSKKPTGKKPTSK